MTERLRAEMREMVQVASERHLVGVEAWTARVGTRVRRGRRVRGAAMAGAAAAVLAGVLVAGSSPAHRLEPTPPVTPAPTPSGVQHSGVLKGWHDAGVDPALFGAATITDAVEVDGRIVAVGCDPEAGGVVRDPAAASPEPPIWFGTADGRWRRATVEAPAAYCLHQVVSTPYGLFAAGTPGLADPATYPSHYVGPLLRSSDGGETWTGVALDPGADGLRVQVPVVGVLADRVVAVTTRTTVDDLRTATLWTTADGDTWTRVGTDDWPRTGPGLGTDPARVFDDAEITDMAPVDGRLVAVGFSVSWGVEGRAWASGDGLEWDVGVFPGRDDCGLVDIVGTSGGVVGAGWCLHGPGLAQSADGTTWRWGSQAPAEEGSFTHVQAVQVLGDRLLVAGWSADGSSAGGTPRQWLVTPDGSWHRVDRLIAPFAVVDGVGFWPRAGAGPTTMVLVED
jgi:hypothetical protein